MGKKEEKVINLEEKEEVKEVKKKKDKKPQTLAVTIAVICFLLVFFMFGWMLGIMRGYRESNQMIQNNTNEEKTETVEKETTVPENVKVTDQFAISTYGGYLKYYIISDGKVYYKLEKDSFAGVNVCAGINSYCENNSKYNNNVIEIAEIENAIRIKTVPDVGASGERFIYFVITDSKVYQLSETNDANGTITGVKVTVIDKLSDKKIVDLVEIRNKKYIFETSSGEKVEY